MATSFAITFRKLIWERDDHKGFEFAELSMEAFGFSFLTVWAAAETRISLASEAIYFSSHARQERQKETQ